MAVNIQDSLLQQRQRALTVVLSDQVLKDLERCTAVCRSWKKKRRPSSRLKSCSRTSWTDWRWAEQRFSRDLLTFLWSCIWSLSQFEEGALKSIINAQMTDEGGSEEPFQETKVNENMWENNSGVNFYWCHTNHWHICDESNPLLLWWLLLLWPWNWLTVSL